MVPIGEINWFCIMRLSPYVSFVWGCGRCPRLRKCFRQVAPQSLNHRNCESPKENSLKKDCAPTQQLYEIDRMTKHFCCRIVVLLDRRRIASHILLHLVCYWSVITFPIMNMLLALPCWMGRWITHWISFHYHFSICIFILKHLSFRYTINDRDRKTKADPLDNEVQWGNPCYCFWLVFSCKVSLSFYHFTSLSSTHVSVVFIHPLGFHKVALKLGNCRPNTVSLYWPLSSSELLGQDLFVDVFVQSR